jgi:hypothetical protein
MKNFSRNATVAAGVGVLFVLSFGGLARAITDTVFRYATPQTGHYSISPMALAPTAGGNTDYSITEHAIAPSPANTFGCFVTGLNLPERARITELRIWAATDTNTGVQAILFRSELANFPAEALVNMISHDTSAVRFAMAAAVPADKAVVLNQRYSYAVEICMGGNSTQFNAGRITYIYANAGD